MPRAGDNITIKFFVLENAKIPGSKISGDVLDDALEEKILEELRCDAKLNQKVLAELLQTLVPSIQSAMSRLKNNGLIVCKGGKRFGYWEIS